MNVRTITTQIASAFTLAGKDPRKTVDWSRRSISAKLPVGRNLVVPLPLADFQCDKVVHWPEIDENRSPCQKCNMTCNVKYFKSNYA